MMKDEQLEVYIGGDETHKSHFDADRFGYFDLIDEIKQLGYGKWSRVAFKVPKTMKMIDIKDDKDVMLMLSYLELRICVLHVYVVGGEPSKMQVEDVDGSVGGKQGDEFCEDESEGEYDWCGEDKSEDGDGCGEDETEGEDDGPGMEKGEGDRPSMEKGEHEGDQQCEDCDEYEDVSYIPSTEKDEDTDDSSLDGFISDDNEYIQARDKFKKSNLKVITDDLF